MHLCQGPKPLKSGEIFFKATGREERTEREVLQCFVRMEDLPGPWAVFCETEDL